MIWNGMVYDMIWNGMVYDIYDVIWYDMEWYGIYDMIWYGI
jgi:hypothetical protein